MKNINKKLIKLGALFSALIVMSCFFVAASGYVDGLPGDTVTTTTTTSSSGGGGGGGSSGASTYTINTEQLESGYTKELGVNARFKLTIENETHYVNLTEVTTSTATIVVSSTPQTATLAVGDTRRFELTGDDYYDIQATLNSVNSTSSKAEFTIKENSEQVTEEGEIGEKEKQESAEKKRAEDLKKSIFKKWWFWLIVVLVAVGVWQGIRNKK